MAAPMAAITAGRVMFPEGVPRLARESPSDAVTREAMIEARRERMANRAKAPVDEEGE
ncbi:MAG: hypothetical protein LBI87_05765 [Candidatus Accumulibacter sp.]|jgi:hypothetical protein|nr:hypothetical protein [Accumulibacter sp.]